MEFATTGLDFEYCASRKWVEIVHIRACSVVYGAWMQALPTGEDDAVLVVVAVEVFPNMFRPVVNKEQRLL